MKNLVFGVTILAGLILRFLYPLQRVFSFDQEQIALSAQRILEGKLTLVGPLAGLIQFFTGPLIYYLAAINHWLTQGHPLANTFIGVSIYLITAVVLWLFLRRLVSLKAASIFIGIYSLSTYMVSLDRVTWNPNLSFISAGLVLAGLTFTKRKLSYMMGFLGMLLAYQAHFSAFVMAAGVILICLCLRRWRFLIFSLSGLLISLVPTFIFDLRHDWLNTLGLRQLINNPELVSSGLSIQSRFINIVFISLENLTKIIIPVLPHWSLIGLGSLILGFWLWSKSSIFNSTQRLIILAWILVFPLIMMFYRGSVPEYYFLMQLPAFVFILTDLLINIRAKLPPTVVLTGFFLIALGMVIQEAQTLAAGPSLNNKLRALEYIKENQIDQPIDLVLDMAVKDRFGWSYLIDYLDLPLGESQTKVHLIFPVNPGTIISAKFGGVGAWVDRRGQIEAQAFVDDIHGILFYYPNDFWQIELNQPFKTRAFTPQNLAGKAAVNGGILYLIVPKNEHHKYFGVLSQVSKPGNLDRWQYVNLFQDELAGRKTLTRERKEDLFIFSFPQDYTWQEIELFLSRVEGF